MPHLQDQLQRLFMTLTPCEVGRCISLDGLGIEVDTGLRKGRC